MEVERVAEDRLSREVWRFRASVPRWGNADRICLVVDYYGREVRASTRHKFKADPATRFDSFDRRPYHSGIKAEDVPLPDDVIEEARRRLTVNVQGPN